MQNSISLITNFVTTFLNEELECLSCRCITKYSSKRNPRTTSNQSDIRNREALNLWRDLSTPRTNQVVHDERSFWNMIARRHSGTFSVKSFVLFESHFVKA